MAQVIVKTRHLTLHLVLPVMLVRILHLVIHQHLVHHVLGCQTMRNGPAMVHHQLDVRGNVRLGIIKMGTLVHHAQRGSIRQLVMLHLVPHVRTSQQRAQNIPVTQQLIHVRGNVLRTIIKTVVLVQRVMYRLLTLALYLMVPEVRPVITRPVQRDQRLHLLVLEPRVVVHVM